MTSKWLIAHRNETLAQIEKAKAERKGLFLTCTGEFIISHGFPTVESFFCITWPKFEAYKLDSDAIFDEAVSEARECEKQEALTTLEIERNSRRWN